jgi:hypothetical protein
MGAVQTPDALVLPLSPTTTIHASGPIYLVDASSLPRHLLRGRRRGSSARRRGLVLAALLFVSILTFFEPHLQAGLAQALLRARSGRAAAPARALDFPVQSCCIGQQCLAHSKGRHAVVTHVRSQREVTQLQVSLGRVCGPLVLPLPPYSGPTPIQCWLQCRCFVCRVGMLQMCAGHPHLVLEEPHTTRRSLTPARLPARPLCRSNWRPA